MAPGSPDASSGLDVITITIALLLYRNEKNWKAYKMIRRLLQEDIGITRIYSINRNRKLRITRSKIWINLCGLQI